MRKVSEYQRKVCNVYIYTKLNEVLTKFPDEYHSGEFYMGFGGVWLRCYSLLPFKYFPDQISPSQKHVFSVKDKFYLIEIYLLKSYTKHFSHLHPEHKRFQTFLQGWYMCCHRDVLTDF